MDDSAAALPESPTNALDVAQEAGTLSPPLPPPPPAPPPASAPSKRRWSPCTWRYAIEELQPELGSRPRHSTAYANGHSMSAAGSRDHQQQQQQSRRKAASPAGENGGLDQIASRHSPSRAGYYYYQSWEDEEDAYRRTLQRRREAEEERAGGVNRKKRQQQQQKLEVRSAKRRCSPGKATEVQEEAGHVWTPGELSGHQKGRKRELSPSELYFCEICSAHSAANGRQVGAHSL